MQIIKLGRLISYIAIPELERQFVHREQTLSLIDCLGGKALHSWHEVVGFQGIMGAGLS